MKVVNPEILKHIIKLVPRLYPVGAIKLIITNETTKVQSDIANTYTIEDGVLFLDFDFTFEEKHRYEMKLLNDYDVLYRGKIIATTQESEDYKLTKDLYFYE